MKILVISDSHGNLSNLKHVMGFAKKLNIDAVIHAGDWNTIESVETVLSFGFLFIRFWEMQMSGPKLSKN